MKGTFGAFLGRSLAVAVVTSSILATSGSTVGASSVTTTTRAPSVLSACGVVASPSVHFVSKDSPCVIRVRVGTNVRIKLRSGFRWGYPTSNSRAVVVTTISRSSTGVHAATLHAAAVGHATIHATGTVYCKPGVVCPDLALLWSLRVIVT
jgi:hypothetical protein